MISFVRAATSHRKARLFACACCYRVYGEHHEDELECVEVAERFADGKASVEELAEAEDLLDQGDYRYWSADYTASVDAEAVWGAAASAQGMLQYNSIPGPHTDDLLTSESAAQAALLRDIFGNPFRPVTLDPSWLTSNVRILARGIYDDRAFGRMPILADALQDAGCENEDILNHCRDANQVHVRGCWVVDLVLGKS